MIRKLVLSHGPLAAELLAAAEKIAGSMSEFTALCLDWDESFETSRQRTCSALRDLGFEDGQQVLILVDMYGGTPYNVAATFRSNGRVELVTGANLPMVVRLGCRCNDDFDLQGLAHWIQGKGRSSISTAADDCRQPPATAQEPQRTGPHD